MKYIALLTCLCLTTCANAERIRMYTDRDNQENVIAGPVRVIDTTNQTGSIELDGEAITKWSDVVGFSTGTVASVFGRYGAVTADETDYDEFYALITEPVFTNWIGTNTYVQIESDPVWLSEKSGYATGTPLYVETYLGTITGATMTAGSSDSATASGGLLELTWNTNAVESGGSTITNIGYGLDGDGDADPLRIDTSIVATGSPVYVESDPVWIAEKANYATGTPIYTESDPIWISEKSNYATGTPVYVESDPVWATYLSDTFTGAVESIAGESGISESTATSIAETVLSASLDSVSTDSAADKQYVLDNAGGVAEIPLNGSSVLDWGVLNGTMGRITSNGYSTLYGDYDSFRYTDSLPLYSTAGGTVTTNYIGLWRDANATVSIIQQVSTNNGSTWDAVTNNVSATTNATVFGLNSIDLNAGANLYRVAIETNATSGTIYIYQIDARGQL